MGWISNFISNPIGTVAGTVSSVVDSVANVLDKVVSGINKTVNNILKDPLPTIAAAVGAYYGIPVYVSSAAVTAARGGSIQDIAKTAAISYATASALKGTGVGDMTADIGKSIGASTTAAVGNAVTSGLNTSVVSGVRAALTNRDIGDAMAQGFGAGVVYSGVNSGTNAAVTSLNQDLNWGLSPEAVKQISAVSSVAIQASIYGNDPSMMVGAYIANATMNAGLSESGKALKEKTAEAQAEADKLAAQEAKQAQALEASLSADKFIQNQNYWSSVALEKDRTALAARVDAFNAGDPSVDGAQLRADLQKYQLQYETLYGNGAPILPGAYRQSTYEAANALQGTRDAYAAAVAELKNTDAQFQQLVADTAIKDFTVDAIESGVIAPVYNPDGKEGTAYFANGFSVDKDGNLYQGDKLLGLATSMDSQSLESILKQYETVQPKDEAPIEAAPDVPETPVEAAETPPAVAPEEPTSYDDLLGTLVDTTTELPPEVPAVPEAPTSYEDLLNTLTEPEAPATPADTRGYYDELTGKYIYDPNGTLAAPLDETSGTNLSSMDGYTYDPEKNVWTMPDGTVVDLGYLSNTRTPVSGSDLEGGTDTTTQPGVVGPSGGTAGGTARPVTPPTSVTLPNMGGGSDMASLLGLLGMAGGAQQAQQAQPQQTGPQLVDIGEQLDLGAPLETNPFAREQTQTKMAQGGSIDDLLALLRRG